jgi:hypothetical protein
MEVIRDWDIAHKLSYIVMDNTGNNDTIMTYISEGTCFIWRFSVCQLTFIELLHSYNISYDSTTYRLRCQGHIINLSVNSFLYVTDKENLEEDREVI